MVFIKGKVVKGRLWFVGGMIWGIAEGIRLEENISKIV